MLAGPTRDADMRQGGKHGRETRLARGNGRCPDQPWATAAAILAQAKVAMLAQAKREKERDESAVAVLGLAVKERDVAL